MTQALGRDGRTAAPRGSLAPGKRKSLAPTIRRSAPPGRRGRPREASARILILAGDAQTAETRREHARRAGHEAIAMLWPADVALLVEANSPDIVMLAVGPQDSWGIEVCADLRLLEAGRTLPVMFFVSGARVEDIVERALRAGADDVVRAAVSPGELEARLAVQLRNKRHADMLRALRRERDELELRATLDPLTRVLNRGALEAALAAELGRGGKLAVMFVDLDHFKLVNDQFGHDVGDTVLRELGAYLRRSIRGADVAGRYGGEEFVVCLAGCDMSVAPRVAERHREQISRITFPAQGHPERVTASIGVAVFDPDVPDPSMSALLKRADAAVYEAKDAGRNRVVVAPPLTRRPTDQASATIAEAVSRDPIALAALPRAPSAAEALEARLVEQLNAGHGTLPVIPAVAMEALRMARKANVDITKLSKLVGQDPFIVARLLAVGNSAALYRGARTASLRDAIVRLGLDGTRDILSSIAYWSALPKYHDLLERCSERAIFAARCAKAACRELRISYEPAYLCGLLHDLGEARVLRVLSALPTPPGGNRTIVALVHRYHTQAGAKLAEKWNLHPDIVQACTLHHDESQAGSLPVRVAMMSDLFVRLASRTAGAKLDDKSAAQCEALGLSEERVGVVLRALPD